MSNHHFRACGLPFYTALCFLVSGCGHSNTSSDAGLSTEGTYYSIRRDPRLCPSPLCGGFFASALNAPETVCADQVLRSECYVAALNSDDPALAERARQLSTAIVKGQILPKTFESFGNLGQLTITEAWQQITP